MSSPRSSSVRLSRFLADVGFSLQRGLGLFRRGLVSLRSRGWRATWDRVRLQLRRASPATASTLYAPQAIPFAPFSLASLDATSAATPSASIVIPVYNGFAHTLNCLRALAAHPPAASFEVIVVDDGSSDETTTALPQIAGVRYRVRSENGGFIAACNDGAAQARGDYLVFLNNDTVPQPGWLDALLAHLRRSCRCWPRRRAIAVPRRPPARSRWRGLRRR